MMIHFNSFPARAMGRPLDRFTGPGMDQESRALYEETYGDSGAGMLDILHSSPYEIALISRLTLHLHQLLAQKEVNQNGLQENHP